MDIRQVAQSRRQDDGEAKDNLLGPDDGSSSWRAAHLDDVNHGEGGDDQPR